MIKYVCWIETKLRDSLVFDGTRDVEEFLEDLSLTIPKEQWVPALDITIESHLL
jgi:hypothetical protein